MQEYYDKSRARLVYCGHRATPVFWDRHWHKHTVDLRKETISCKNNPFIINPTKKYIPNSDSTILEGGCGKAQNVYSLKFNGYDAIGIDFAKKTVDAINQVVPEIDVRFGDVRNLDFPDDFFDGYWSIGVIEHFWEGYDKISKEMKRVIKPNGVLFLTFPYLSPLRKLKIKFGFYEQFTGKVRPSSFYQFALNHEVVADNFGKLGFQLIEQRPFDPIKGLKDEVVILKPFLQRLYEYRGNNIFVTMLKEVISILFKGISAHCILLIFKNNKKIEGDTINLSNNTVR